MRYLLVIALLMVAAPVMAVDVTEEYDEFTGVTSRSFMLERVGDEIMTWTAIYEEGDGVMILGVGADDYFRPATLYLLIDGERRAVERVHREFDREGSMNIDIALFFVDVDVYREIADADEVRYRLSGSWSIEGELTDAERAAFGELLDNT